MDESKKIESLQVIDLSDDTPSEQLVDTIAILYKSGLNLQIDNVHKTIDVKRFLKAKKNQETIILSVESKNFLVDFSEVLAIQFLTQSKLLQLPKGKQLPPDSLVKMQ